MRLKLNINEQDYVYEVDPSEKLLFLLRREKFFSVKSGCENGHCGSCTVLLDDHAVTSCTIPVGILNNSKILTVDFFMKKPVYADIAKGFEKAGVSMCGYCNAGKIFACYEAITENKNPTREIIYKYIYQLKDCCVEKDILINGIVYASQLHFEKENRKKNGI